MDQVLFTTDNNEYIIEITKEPRTFGYSTFGNYICHIKFYDFLHRVLLDLQCNEKKLAELINILYDDAYLLSGDMFSIEFDNNIFVIIGSSEIAPFPTENDPFVYFQVFEDHPIYGRISRMFLQNSLTFKDNMVYNIYNILSDIPYLEQLLLFDESYI